MKPLYCETAQITLQGDRENNEDRSLLLRTPNATLAVLGDGMGGHPKGEVAAQILIDTCRQMFERAKKPVANPQYLIKMMLLQSHGSIVTYGNQQQPPIKPRTTAVVCLIQNNNFYWAHAGDSRLYLVRNGEVSMRTKDHSYVQNLQAQGVINAEQGSSHPYRNYVTRCLGGTHNPPKVTTGDPIPLQPSDLLLLCSDGFWGQLDEQQIIQQLIQAETPLHSALQQLATAAEQTSVSESDNVTAIALRWHAERSDEALAHNFSASFIDTDSTDPLAMQENVDVAIDTLRHAVDNFDSDNSRSADQETSSQLEHNNMRPSGRNPDQLRPITITRNFTKHAEGSVLVEFGDTKVLCNASVSGQVPRFLKGKGQGWITAEYGMLPRSTGERMGREASRGRQGGRTLEIQRLIGRSLRAAVNLEALGEHTITLDCDVIQADGGTRTASITGAFVALCDAVNGLLEKGRINRDPIISRVASVSVGIYQGVPILDLDYAEDSNAETDMNVVMNDGNAFIEVQGTAEGHAFQRQEFDAMLSLAEQGIRRLLAVQQEALEGQRV